MEIWWRAFHINEAKNQLSEIENIWILDIRVYYMQYEYIQKKVDRVVSVKGNEIYALFSQVTLQQSVKYRNRTSIFRAMSIKDFLQFAIFMSYKALSSKAST